MTTRKGASHTDVVVLGLLAQQPRHAYEIISIIRRIHLTDWAKVGSATVYTSLRKLEDRRFATAALHRPSTRPERRVYEITDAGRAHLQHSVRSLLSSRTPVHSDRLVGAAFSWALERPAAKAALEASVAGSVGQLARLRQVFTEAADTSHVTRLVLGFLMGIARAEADALSIALAHESRPTSGPRKVSRSRAPATSAPGVTADRGAPARPPSKPRAGKR